MQMPSPTEILDQIGIAIASLDSQLEITYLNQAAEGLFGAGSDSSIGKPMSQLFQSAECTPTLLRNCLSEYRDTTLREATIIVNQERRVLADIMVTTTSTGDIVLAIQQLDRFRRISKQDHLRLTEEASQLLAQGMAHEVKNPLGGIRGAAQLLRRELTTSDQIEFTDIIIHESDRLRMLVDRMLGQRQTPNVGPVNIHEVIERVIRVQFADARQNTLLIREYDPSVPPVAGEFDQLIQAIMNVVKNAKEAVECAPKPTIRFATGVEHQFTVGGRLHPMVVNVTVENNGPPIPHDKQEQIFYPLVGTKPSGSGLGLAITRSIIVAHGGVLECESVDNSTQFRFSLPIHTSL